MATVYEEKKYQPGAAVEEARRALLAQQGSKPGAYVSQFQSGLDDLLGQIRGRDKFQYDVNSDALYRQVAQNYLRQGQQAMMDTLGKAAAMTGGYGNSYAQTAGQQAYDQYLLGLAELVPQFRQMAFQQYQAEGEDLLDQYEILLRQEENAYDRYREDLNQYYTELDRLQSAYDSERSYDYDRFTQDRDFDYGRYMDELNYRYQLERDKTEDEQWLQKWLYQQERDRIADSQWQQEFDESVRQYNEGMAWKQAQAAAKSSGSSGKGSGSGTSEYKKTQELLSEGGYNSAEMLKIIRGSSLTEKQQEKLITDYQKPKQTEEVLRRDPSRDTSAWANR